MAPIILLIPFGPLTRWQHEQLRSVAQWLMPWLLLALLIAGIAFLRAPLHPLKTATAYFASLWIALGTARFIWQRLKQNSGRFSAEMNGMILAHTGVAVFCFGALMTEALSVEKDVAAAPGQSFEMGDYRFSFHGVRAYQGPNFSAQRGEIAVEKNSHVVVVLHPEKRLYASGGNMLTEADMHGGISRDIYVALGEPLDQHGTWALRLHVKPFIRWIWFGALLMALGALVVSFDKRFKTKARRL